MTRVLVQRFIWFYQRLFKLYCNVPVFMKKLIKLSKYQLALCSIDYLSVLYDRNRYF